MKGTRCWILSIVALLVTSAAAAQTAPAGVQTGSLDLAVSYDTLHTNHVAAQSFWMQGGAVELGARVYDGLGIAARVEGLHAGANTAAGEPLSLVTAVFGPRYTVEIHDRRYSIFGESLLGISAGFDSLFSEGSGPVGSVNAGTTSSANSFALDIGGGLDVRLNRQLEARVLRASYFRTQFPNTTTSVQNNLSLSAGIVLRLGK